MSSSSALATTGAGRGAAGSAAAAGASSALADFWKDDFAPLNLAGRAILNSLREEEDADDADLYRRLSSSGAGSHLYFPPAGAVPLPAAAAAYGTGGAAALSAGTAKVTSTVEHVETVSLPPLLQEELKSVRSHSFMGLLAPASLAWMSVDDKVFLWPFRERGSFCSFQVPSGQSVITVGLIKPKKGVFRAHVEWCLVITTPDEVILCALVRAQSPLTMNGVAAGGGSVAAAAASHPPEGGLCLVPTSYRLATDSVRMLSVCGTASGRIFMGGDDGCLYEMSYQGQLDQQRPSSGSVSLEERLNKFYEEGEDVPAVLTADSDSSGGGNVFAMGKRTWNALSSTSSSNGSSHDGAPRNKCRKLNRTSHASSWVSAVLPDFVVKAGSFIFGGKTSTGGGRIERMAVDEDRECLYTLGSDGWICSFDLRPLSPGKDSIRLAAVMQTPGTVRLYLEAVSRGQMLAPVAYGASMGCISFPGGGAAAQAGVGGMEGARAILKAADLVGAKPHSRARGTGDNILKPISIHVVPPTESQRLTLMAVTAGGLRLYLSSLATNVLSSGPNASRQSNPLAPSSRLTLCHVRAPPPADMGRLQNLTSSDDAGVLGGIKPQVVVGSAAEKVPRVDATFYKQGIFVAAVENRMKQQGGVATQQQTVGDVVVTACPDSVARNVDSLEGSREKDKQTLIVPGGITETASMPMLSAYLPNSGVQPILPGGLVWDIASVDDEETVVMRLTWHSRTPTDTELGVGLPPAYFPPSKIRSRGTGQLSTANGGRSNSQQLALRSNSSLSSTALKVLGNVLTSALLSRPINQGITFQPPSLQGDLYHGASLTREYRISKRIGSSGFSATAGEKSRYSDRNGVITRTPSNASRGSKAARLRPWLLKPAAVPLNQFSTQHLTKPKQVVALNAGGLQYFSVKPVLYNLADTLVSAGENVRNDPAVSSFFTSYGYKEGCTMCLALAIGCGPASGDSNSSEQIRFRAVSAALARSYVPRLVLSSDRNEYVNKATTSVITSDVDSQVPSGYVFLPSELSNGLNSLISRLVRPIWHKPAVVVTEGRVIKQQWSSCTRTTPAKVEVLLSESALEDVRGPLRSLLGLMKNVFSPAVKTIPGLPENQGMMMDIETENGDSQFLTRALQYRGQLVAGSGSSNNQLAPAEADSIARLIEEKNIHSLYRLISRAVQLLNLIQLLYRAQYLSELREVDWGLLHGLTISQLVQTPDGQDRLESLLNALVTTSSCDGRSAPSAQADQLADEFGNQCYLYFSPGSRSAYHGIKDANEALSCSVASRKRKALGKRAADHLRSAAKHWYSAPLITGRILHTKDQENFEQISIRALQYGSPLAKAVDALMKLHDVAGVVDVCLLTASNFRESGSQAVNASINPFAVDSKHSAYDLPWEQNLYHKRRDPESNGTATSTRPPASPSSPTHVVAYGATVTSKDAVDTCYALIFHHLSILLGSSQELADKMVSACVDAKDTFFLHSLFRFLLESDRADMLLRINLPELEKWLQGRNNPDLLWRYYDVQGKINKAARVSWDRANDSGLKLPLSDRIDCLTRALNSLERDAPLDYRFSAVDDVPLEKKDVRDSLRLAKIQNRMLGSVRSQKIDLSDEELERLGTSLVPVSELYNDYASRHWMSEYCLLILQACESRHDDAIATHWKHIICEEILPCATRSEFVHSYLQQFVSDQEIGDKITFLGGQSASDSLLIFESGDWAKGLEARMVELGKEMYSPGSEYIFPVEYLLKTLEELRCCAERSLEPNWSLFVFVQAGVPFLVILDAYEGCIQQDEVIFSGTAHGVDLRKRVEQISNMLSVIECWINSARNLSTIGGSLANGGTVNGGVETAALELKRAVASGRLAPKLDGMRSKLETMPNSAGLLQRIRNIEESIHYMHSY